MPILHQYDYIFAVGTIFALLDAYMIGANDVANSWATSVSSKTFTLRQAVLFAAVFEFLGAVTAGARVTGTIKNGIIPGNTFGTDPGLQMLAFCIAIMCSSIWLTIATRMSWPVSTTYSIVSAITGVGIAVGGFDAPHWGWNNSKGLAAIWAGLFIAPALSAAFAAAVFLIVKFGVLHTRNPTRTAFITGPFWFFLVSAICTMSIIYKGAPQLGLSKMSDGKTAAAIILTGVVIAILAIVFWMPFVHAKVIKKDYTIRWYHFFYGPLLWKRPAPADAETVNSHVQDYRIRKDLDIDRNQARATGEDVTAPPREADQEKDLNSSASETSDPAENRAAKANLDHMEKKSTPPLHGPFWLPSNLWIIFRYKIIGALLHGTSVNIHDKQMGRGTSQESHMEQLMARARQYPNETEHLFSFLQVLTACTASFAHGSNDLSNAIGPFSVIYYTWKNSEVAGSTSPVPVWQLAMGAGALVIGLATYGYNIIAVLGNKITLISPSRGFTIELGASITVILASQYAIPVSTTMCATGATIGVGLCNGNFRAVNWRQILNIYIGWIGTIVVVAILAALVMAFIINAPRLP